LIVVFGSKKLAELYMTGTGIKLHPDVIRAFIRAVGQLIAASNEQDIRTLRGRDMHKLEGERAGQYAIRLNDRYRLVFTIEHGTEGTFLLVHELINYH